ncbi:M20/M25/M40 family metallo-hydrolase [Gymnodinialimonas hymeniacidonis]|uniref:M20/M25/M40 family metallo-hydrolase n=1 Tax=Gymnodinialimonas hymeniacidonis TaxID=3126508 RepID=UPI0034C62280
MFTSELSMAGLERARGSAFKTRLAQLIAQKTDAQTENAPQWAASYFDLISQWLAPLSFTLEQHGVPGAPFLIARRIEDPVLPTVLTYSHGDVVPGMEGDWAEGRDPWTLTEAGEHWFGRGIADNKGQFLVNLTAVETVLAERHALGFNLIWLIEMGEEIGSPGLAEICMLQAKALKADVLLASDGPRVAAETPTLFLGARGGMTFRLDLEHRESGRHSGNFGGALRNPAIELAHALTSIVDRNGGLQIDAWTPGHIPDATRAALKTITPAGGAVDEDWGVAGLTPAERIHAWSSAEVLALHAGHPPAPVNAIPPKASAWVQLRYAPGTRSEGLLEALRTHLDEAGFSDVTITPEGPSFRASATPVDHQAVKRLSGVIEAESGQPPAILPSLGGSLPNDIFREVLGLPTIWVPHSYPECSQHAPNEHLPKRLLFEATGLMAAILGSFAGTKPEDWH